MRTLSPVFHKAVATLLSQSAGAENDLILQDLETRYNEHHRFYHTLAHIEDCLIKASRQAWQDERAIIAAFIDHDAILDMFRYARDYQGPSNEQLSAAHSISKLRHAGFEWDFADRVADLIRSTQTHTAGPDDTDAQKFIDIDMSILCEERPVYETYALNNAREFLTFFSSEQYELGRRMFLIKTRGSLIYTIPEFARNLSRAMQNMTWEEAHLPGIIREAIEKNRQPALLPRHP